MLNEFLDMDGFVVAACLMRKAPSEIRTLLVYEGILGLAAQVCSLH